MQSCQALRCACAYGTDQSSCCPYDAITGVSKCPSVNLSVGIRPRTCSFCKKISESNGFIMYSSAPADMALRMDNLDESSLTMITLGSCTNSGISRNQVKNSIPSITGISRARTIKPIPCCTHILVIACSPFAASTISPPSVLNPSSSLYVVDFLSPNGFHLSGSMRWHYVC